MLDCRNAPTSMNPGMHTELTSTIPASIKEKEEMVDVPYKEVIGQLLYLSTRTRPDISLAVGILSRRVTDLKVIHWTALRRVLRYVKEAQGVGVKISPQNNILELYADADWSGGSDRTSVSGYILQLGGCTVGWKCVKQKIVSGSSTESEYISLLDASKETLCVRNFMNEIGEMQESGGILIHQENSGSIAWAKGNGQRKRTKPIDVRYHVVQQLIS